MSRTSTNQLNESHFNVTEELSVDDESEENKNGEKQRDSWLLYISAFTATLILFGSGTAIVWTSPVIARLKLNDTHINPLGSPVTTLQIAQIAGLPSLGALISPLLCSQLCDISGRRRTLICLSAIMLLADIVLAFSKHIYLYYISRFILGLSTGMAISTISIFISEISEDHNRSKIGCFIGLSFPLGNLFVYIVGPLLSIKIFTLLCAVPHVVNLLGFFLYIPESPVWLASKGQEIASIHSLEKLRNKSPKNIEKEYQKILSILQETSASEKKSLGTLFKVQYNRRALIIAIGCNLIQQFSGVSAILAFAGPLFDETNSKISGNTTAILIGIIKILTLLLATGIIENAGKRLLLLISSLGSSISLFALGLFFYLQSIKSPWIESLLWLPVASVLTYFILYSIGIGCIPMAIMGELFPNNIKSIAVSLVTFILMTSVFIITTSFPLIKELIGATWCIWGFSTFCLIGFIFVYFMVPEIKGKSLLEVQEIFSK